LSGELNGDPGLPDPGFAADQKQTATTGLRRFQAGQQCV
jgi:hypothetical protein